MFPKMMRNRKGNVGVSIFLGIVLFNIIMYIVIYSANSDPTVEQVGVYSDMQNNIAGNSSADLSVSTVSSWTDGFKVSVFTGGRWWVDIFYVTFQGVLIAVGAYSLIRGLN